jgi:hypothetical protein
MYGFKMSGAEIGTLSNKFDEVDLLERETGTKGCHNMEIWMASAENH